jgi:hypothetical protein
VLKTCLFPGMKGSLPYIHGHGVTVKTATGHPVTTRVLQTLLA